jgi:KDO2-lipid IV(A) lauroyltransferase
MTGGDLLDWSLFRLMKTLPIDACSGLGGVLRHAMGRRGHPVADARASALLGRLRPDWAAEPALLSGAMDRLWDSIVRTHVEFAVSHRLLAAGRAPVEDPTALRDVLASGAPVIAMFVHLGNWELAAHQLAAHAPHRVLVIYDPPAGQARQQIALQVRGRSPLEMRPISRTVWRAALQHLGTPDGILWVAADEVAERRVGAPFFDRKPILNGNLAKIARLAMRTGALVMPLWCERRGGAHFMVRTLPPLRFEGHTDSPDAVLQAVVALNEAITPPVLGKLDQWYMATEYRG